MIFDSHCHYNLEPLLTNWQSHWHQAQQKGVTNCLVIGVNLESSEAAVRIAATEPRLWAAVGIHPSEWQEHPQLDLATCMTALQKLVTQSKVVAIGETGLDYYWLKNNNPQVKKLQQASVTAHLELAAKAQLPTILHVRDQEIPETETPGNAYWDMLAILAQHKTETQNVILHCVSGPVNYLQQALQLGAYIGVAGNVTYKNADQLRTLVKMTPSEKLLLETDAPFLPPQDHRGKTCEPWMIAETAEYLQSNLGIDLERVYQNAIKLFLS